MDTVVDLLSRHDRGDRITLKHDVFGNYWAEVRRGWLFGLVERVDLDRHQFFALAEATQRQRRGRSRRRNRVAA